MPPSHRQAHAACASARIPLITSASANVTDMLLHHVREASHPIYPVYSLGCQCSASNHAFMTCIIPQCRTYPVTPVLSMIPAHRLRDCSLASVLVVTDTF